MKVLKFGGTSVANSESISNVISILNSNRNDNLLIVVSALGGITNLLQECLSLKGKSTDNVINEIEDIISGSNVTCSFQSTLTIYESQYKCTLNPNEFTYTQNPSAISGSANSGIVYDFLTGSYFEPYITTVGLYNNANQLVAVGKLSQPLQSSNVSDTTILVNLDL